jgi:16S rRNA (uracil1498-N3)-methyltransferase
VLFNGKGGEFHAIVAHITKKQINVSVGAFHQKEVESSLQIHLAQSMPRGDKLDYIVQKAVELGVFSVTPIIAERSQGRLSKEQEQKKLTRLQAIVIAASEQCGRNRLLKVYAPMTLPDWIASTNHHDGVSYILAPNTTESTFVPPIKKPETVSLLVGPEGGLTASETALAKERGFTNLTLGKRILRTETASLAAISVMQWCFGDFQ